MVCGMRTNIDQSAALYREELVVDEATGEMLVVYAATLEELDTAAYTALDAA